MAVTFNYGSLDKYKALANKDSNALYFLDNHLIYKGDEFLSNVHAVNTFVDLDNLTDSHRLNFYINLNTGELRYVTDGKKYISVSSLVLNNLQVTVNSLLEFIDSITIKEVTMPTLQVVGDTVIWTASNVEKENFLIKETI